MASELDYKIDELVEELKVLILVLVEDGFRV